MVDGKALMQLDFKAKTSQRTIHILIRTIQVGETIQISSGGSSNNLNNKEALGSNLRASIPSNTHQHKPHNNLPKTPQIAEFVGQFREQGKLPSSTVINLNGGFESAKAMSLRSGKQVGSDPQSSKLRSNEVEKLIIEEDEQSTPTAKVETPLPQAPNAPKLSNSANKGELKNDGVIIQLADRSNVYPKGVLEDVLVQVNHLIFPVDFYVLEMDESDHSPTLPILLGRPFMKTACTKIDVFNETLTMEFDGEVINFNLSDSIKYPNEDHSCFFY
ncbi:hypothetical protein ACFX13_001736 [Malus domestica]